MNECSKKLYHSLLAWQEWAGGAEQHESGWESDAPNWEELIGNAQELLLSGELLSNDLSNIEKVLSISEEGEVLADFIKENLGNIHKLNIRRLLGSSDTQVRWQVYDSLVAPNEFCRELLREGTLDQDDYVRRRAFLRLMAIEKPAEYILKRALTDSDQVIRDEATRLLADS